MSQGKNYCELLVRQNHSKEEGAHRNGDIHIHDLDCLTGYCAGWSLRVLLNEGLTVFVVEWKVVLLIILEAIRTKWRISLEFYKAEWAGAQAFSSFDTYLAPFYVFKDNLSYDDVLKAIQFVYNLNVACTMGTIAVYDITLDWVVPDDLKKQIPTRNEQHLFQGNYF